MKVPAEFILKQVAIGPMANFLYFIGDAKTKQVAVVDPGWDADEIMAIAQQNGWQIVSVLFTHGHYDHANAALAILDRADVPGYMSAKEFALYRVTHKNMVFVDDHQKVAIGGIEIECILTPGHSSGCLCFRYKNVLLTGDTLFTDGCGRCDLPGGNVGQMYTTLYGTLAALPDDTIIYPGHGYGEQPAATLGEIKKTNFCLQCTSREQFIAMLS